MEPFEDLVVDEKKRISGNIWGWKWSWISLVIIVVGFLFLFLVGPKEEAGAAGEGAAADTTSVINE